MSAVIVRALPLGGLVAAALACGGSNPSGTPIAECLSWEQVPTAATFFPGDVIVGFVEGTTREDAEQLFREQALAYELAQAWDRGHTSAVACVGPGNEQEWIERLEAEELVEYAVLNDVGYIQEEGEGPR